MLDLNGLRPRDQSHGAIADALSRTEAAANGIAVGARHLPASWPQPPQLRTGLPSGHVADEARALPRLDVFRRGRDARGDGECVRVRPALNVNRDRDEFARRTGEEFVIEHQRKSAAKSLTKPLQTLVAPPELPEPDSHPVIARTVVLVAQKPIAQAPVQHLDRQLADAFRRACILDDPRHRRSDRLFTHSSPPILPCAWPHITHANVRMSRPKNRNQSKKPALAKDGIVSSPQGLRRLARAWAA